MIFKEITDSKKWNEFIMSNDQTDILQSWEWAKTKEIEGWQNNCFAVVNDEDEIIIGGMVLTRQEKIGPIRIGKLAYIPHGPVYNANNIEYAKNAFQIFEANLSDWAKLNNVFAIEIEPKIDETKFKDNRIFNGWKVSGRNRQPKFKLLMDITKSDEEILSGMKKSTRYNIKYAEKKEVEIKIYKFDSPEIDEKIDKFYSLLQDMQERAKYPIRSKEYFKKLVDEFKSSDRMILVEASYEGEVIVMNISQFTDYWASSFYAGSNRLHPNVKAPYLLRWASIQEAKRRGCKLYDFWGIIPNSKQHKGYSDNKLSFGGERVDFIGILIKRINWKAWLWELELWLIMVYSKVRYR